MKKITAFILMIACLFAIAVPAAAAAETGTRIYYYEDGSYLVVTVTEGLRTRASGTVTGSTQSTYYNSSGVLQWIVTLNGRFTYDGSTAKCTATNITATIYGSDGWSCSQNSSYASGASAYGSATMVRTVGGSQVSTKPVSLKLTCDKNGNLS